MPKNPPIRTLRLSSRRRAPFVIFLLLALGIVSSLAAGVAAWRPSNLEPGDQICVRGEGCRSSCAEIEPGSICAELTQPGGYVLETCCIPTEAVNSSNPDACLLWATIQRGGGPIE